MSGNAKLPVVIALPWAQARFEDASHQRLVSDRVNRDTQALQVHADHLDVGEAPNAVAQANSPGTQSPAPLSPELRVRGLPQEPWPTVPEEDREPLELDALLRAAVALDVFTTRSKQVEESSVILSALTETATSVGVEGGLGDEGLQELIAIARGPVGVSRERLSAQWSGSEGQGSEESAQTPTVPVRSTPGSVAQSLRRFERGGAAVIREACLLLDALAETDYRSI